MLRRPCTRIELRPDEISDLIEARKEQQMKNRNKNTKQSKLKGNTEQSSSVHSSPSMNHPSTSGATSSALLTPVSIDTRSVAQRIGFSQ